MVRANVKRKLQRAVRRMEKLRTDFQDPQPGPQEEGEMAAIRLKDERGFFTRGAKVCIMELVGECEVPPARCGSIIKAVIRHTLNVTVPDTDLPSTRSAIRFIDQGHFISKVHIADTLLNADGWDLHTDGTSRSGKKYVGHQVTVDGKSLSVGFSPISVENTANLVDITVSLLEEISDLYSEEHAHQTFLDMLQNMSGMMCDRASVMKSTSNAISKLRKDLLQTPQNLQFLHCNAHFLLGLSTACEKTLRMVEKDSGQLLGRDRLPQFRTFLRSSESSVSRYIRIACDCLGPRGDDRNGCREFWEAHCMATEQPSCITSYRSNRFNNFFQAAAAVHFHREDIHLCVKDLPKVNQKLQSLLEDNRSDEIDTELVAVGLLFYRLTGPYWCLLGKEVHYLDLWVYIVRLHRFLTRWAADPADAFSEEPEDIFGFSFMPDRNVYLSLLHITNKKKTAVRAILMKICRECVTVTERQLADFLPGGRYHEVEDLDLRERMKHSKLTNLIGEECFGDLDFSLFKRRNASLHHHSTINLLKRNRSISQFFMLESGEAQSDLLWLSAKKAPSLRKKYLRQEKEAVASMQLVLEETRFKKAAAAEKRRQKVQDTMRKVAPHQGPCVHYQDVDRLLATYRTAGGQKEAVRAELQYQKLVLEHSSPLLKVTGTLPDLVRNLKLFLGADETLAAAPVPLFQHCNPQHPRKRQHLALDDTTSDEPEDSDLSDACAETSEREPGEEEADESGTAPDFVYRQTGEIVAVFYWDKWFIGEVVQIYSEEEAEINFFEISNSKGGSGQNTVFRWPLREDKCKIHKDLIFAHEVALAPSSSSGRSFVITSPTNMHSLYIRFKNTLL